jgi:hypothetical protein
MIINMRSTYLGYLLRNIACFIFVSLFWEHTYTYSTRSQACMYSRSTYSSTRTLTVRAPSPSTTLL